MLRSYFLVLMALVGSTSAMSSVRPSRKAWWAKQVTPDMYTAGRLSEIQVKYASEAGFKSIIAIPTYESEETIGVDILPISPQLEDLVVNQCGMFYGKVNEPGDAWATIEAVGRFTSIVDSAPPPVLVVCFSAVSASFHALAYLANQTRVNPSFTPKVNSAEFYNRAKSMGLFYGQPGIPQLVSSLTGEAVMTNPPTADLAVPDWPNKYWVAKPHGKYVFVSGQIRSNYLNLIGDMGFKAIIHSRKGVTSQPNNEPSQEEVTLLNIKDKTGTYVGTGRQSEPRLLESRIDPNKPNSYVGLGSQVNYASRNPFEYGDDEGYNETMMRLDIEQRLPGVKFFHTPIGGQYKYNMEMWNAHKDVWIAALENNDLVLFACRTAYRSTVAALLTLGTIESQSSEWALEKAIAQGYHFEQEGANDVVKLFQDVLDNPYPKPSSADNLAPWSSMITILIVAVLVLFNW